MVQGGSMSNYPAEPIRVALRSLPDWSVLVRHLQTRFRTGNFNTGLEFVNRVAAVADAAEHHPDIDLRYGYVDIKMISHDVFALTQRDVELASQVSRIAAELGISADPAQVARLELALDTHDSAQIKPFWQAVLGMEVHPLSAAEVLGPAGVLPNLWFQKCEPHGVPEQRFHLDVWVPADQAKERVAAALAAGGVLISADHAPSYTVLADLQGNKVCVCVNPGHEPEA